MLLFPINFEQNVMWGYMAQTVKNFAVLTVEHLGFVIKSRDNVMVDAKLDGKTFNVIKVRFLITQSIL